MTILITTTYTQKTPYLPWDLLNISFQVIWERLKSEKGNWIAPKRPTIFLSFFYTPLPQAEKSHTRGHVKGHLNSMVHKFLL